MLGIGRRQSRGQAADAEEDRRCARFPVGSLEAQRARAAAGRHRRGPRRLCKDGRAATERIAFLVDGAQYDRDIEVTKLSYFGQMRPYFMRQGPRRSYEVIDLQQWFVARSRDGIRLEFPTDAHWNTIARELTAEASASSRLYRTMFALP